MGWWFINFIDQILLYECLHMTAPVPVELKNMGMKLQESKHSSQMAIR